MFHNVEEYNAGAGLRPLVRAALCSALCVRVSSPSAAAAGSCCNSSVSRSLTEGGFCTALYHCVNTQTLLR